MVHQNYSFLSRGSSWLSLNGLTYPNPSEAGKA